MKSLKKYGVGACGPRGFYGTVGGSYKVSSWSLTSILHFDTFFVVL